MRISPILLGGILVLGAFVTGASASPQLDADNGEEVRRGGIYPNVWGVDFIFETDYLFDTDLDDGGSVETWSREFAVEVSGPGAWLGSALAFRIGYEDVKYDFDDATEFFGGSHDPFDHARFLSVDLRIFQGLSEDWGVVAMGRISWNTESGAELSDGRTGFYALGAGYRFSDSFVGGLGFAVFDTFDVSDRDTVVAPVVQLSWQINEDWKFEIYGPQAELSYKFNENTSASFVVEVDISRWRLDDSGPSDGEIARDYRWPVFLKLEHRFEGIGVLDVHAGFDAYRRIEIDNGDMKIRENTDISPFFGISFTVEI